MANPALKSIIIGIAANTLLVLIKGLAGYAGNSYALIADALESLSDILTSIIVYYGFTIAMKEPDENHPYGHGKAEPIATISVSIALLLAATFIAVESFKNIGTSHPLPEPYTLFVLGIVIFIKEILYRYSKKNGDKVESNVVKADAWHHRSDAISSATAFIGISIALIGGEGYEKADDIAALFASTIISYNALLIFKPALAEIMDSAPPAEVEETVRKIACTVKDVRGLDKCLVRKMGMKYYVDLHILVDADRSVREGHNIAHTVKDNIIFYIPKIYDVMVHVEPYEKH